MNVVHVAQRYPPAIGGAETWIEGVARATAARGHGVEVITLRVVDEAALWDEDAPPAREVAVGPVDRVDGVRIVRCRPSATPYALLRLAEWGGVRLGGRVSTELLGRALAAARRADVVHLHHCNVPAAFLGLAAARLARRPTVLTPYFHFGDPRFEQPAVRWLLRRADVVIALSAHEARRLADEWGVRRVVASTNALDPAPWTAAAAPEARAQVRARLGVAAGEPLLVFLGRKVPEKDLPVLGAAAARLAARRPVALALVGPESEWYRGARGAFAAPGLRLIDLPGIPEPAKRALVAAADVLVQPSPHESFGLVFLEAWAAGIPVVGAATGTIAEVVGDAGTLFRPGDAADLAAAVERLLAHPAEAAATAARGRARLAQAYCWTRVVEAVERAYRLARGAEGR